MFIFPSIHKSQALDTKQKPKEENSQSLAILTPNYTVIIPDAIGGPIYISDRKDVLVANTGSLSGNIPIQTIDENGVSIYIVREGDTLSEIAELFNVSINTIKWENNLGKTLRAGQELRILPLTGVSHTVKKGDTFSKIASKYSVEIEDITIFNDIDAKSLKVGQKIIVPNGVKQTTSSRKTYSGTSRKINNAPTGYYIRPTNGRTSSPFGVRRGGYHYGIDIASPTGTPIVASASGTVVKTSCGSGYGICTIIKHNNGTQTLYAHNSRLFVRVGDNVKQGQKIANVGSTGRSTGPHVHFEIQNIKTGAKIRPPFK